MAQSSQQAPPRLTFGHILVIILILAVVAVIPSTVSSIVHDARTEDTEVIYLPDPATYKRAIVRLHVEITDLSESEGLFTVQLRPAPLCDPCPAMKLSVTYVSARNEEIFVGGRTVISLAAGDDPTAEQVELPAAGSPIRYPFDRWGLVLVTSASVVASNGDERDLTVADLGSNPFGLDQPFAVSIQNRVSQLDMNSLSLSEVEGQLPVSLSDLFPGSIQPLQFTRPTYVKTVAALLVVLIAAASLAAIFLTPLDGIAVNTGAMVLGIWGIRSMLLGSDVEFFTAVDLALIVVMVVLLVLISARLLWRFGSTRNVWPARPLASAEASKTAPSTGDPPTSSPS